jgi:hypothetical protein
MVSRSPEATNCHTANEKVCPLNLSFTYLHWLLHSLWPIVIVLCDSNILLQNSWLSLDLGVHVKPSHYTLRHARGYHASALRNWDFQVCIPCATRTLPSLDARLCTGV